IERIAAPGHAERAVPRGAARATRDLAELGGAELAELIAVEFSVGGEGDVVDVEVEPHADRVGGDEIVDIAVLIERNLRIARARAERAKHDRRTAALPADQLGDRVDLVGRKRHDSRAARQTRDLLFAGIDERGKPRAADDMRARQEFLDHRPHGRGAEHKRLLARAAIEDAVGEDVAALEINAKLDLVDREKSDIEIARHGFDGGDPIARIGRLDLLLAGDQRDGILARARGDLVVDLACEQPQRQTDDAGGMREHALDREMRFAGVGRPEHSGHAGAAGLGGALRGRRETESHSWSRLAALNAYRPQGSCITTRRQTRWALTFGTGLERSAPESLETGQSSSVHHEM